MTTTQPTPPSQLAQSIKRQSSYPMIPIEDALKIVHQKLDPLPPSTVPTSQSLGRILAQDVKAPWSLPPFRASIKDGFAIKLCDPSPSNYKVIGESLAGKGLIDPTQSDVHQQALQPGETVYVTTGAPVPPGTDAVVMVENTKAATTEINSELSSSIEIEKIPSMGTDIREIGSDIKKHDIILKKGCILGAAEIGILISCGITRVCVISRPKIGVVSTGDELIDVDQVETILEQNHGQLPFGKIIDSNRSMLLNAVKDSLPFCEAIDLGIVKDDLNTVRETMKNGIEQCNIIITSGGVSMGNKDYIKQVISEVGDVHFGRVRMKPGKPLTFATCGPNSCFIGLPGNPVSCFVCFHLAVCVAARKLAGWAEEDVFGNVVQVKLASDLSMDHQRVEYHRACVKWIEGSGYVAESTGKQASSRLLSARSADALLVIPIGEGKLQANSLVKALLLSPLH